jgi:hypothetical protein
MASGPKKKAEKKAMHKRVGLWMQILQLGWRIKRERPERVKELQPKLAKLKEEYAQWGGDPERI